MSRQEIAFDRTGTGRRAWSSKALCVLLCSLCLLMSGSGCSASKKSTQRVVLENRSLGPMVLTVAPIVNQSGSSAFDPVVVADIVASELSYGEDIIVIPVNRVLGILAQQGLDGIESPDHALDVARLVGADGIVVVSVTDYDPYDPPRVGISAQLFGVRRARHRAGVDPVELSRLPVPLDGPPSQTMVGLLAQTSRVFDASHGSILADIQRYDHVRGVEEGPLGWRVHVVSQRAFVRFCCYETIKSLLMDGSVMDSVAMVPAKDGV